MPARLVFALLSSLLLHLGVLAAIWLLGRQQPAATPAMLEATLRLPERQKAAEPLLKNTLPDQPPRPARHPPAQPAAHAKPGVATASLAAQRKLAQHVYYPPEAIARGLEGEVRLLLMLAPDGTVVDVQIAGTSGHAILDQAAMRAAYAMGALPGAGGREMILPVVFRLQP